MIQKFILGGMRFISCAKFFLPELDVVFEPHHHTNFLVFTSRKDFCLDVLNELITDFPNFEISV